MRTRLWSRLIFGLVLACVACGGQGGESSDNLTGTSAEKWSADVCDAIAGWQVDFGAQDKLLRQATSNVTSVREARELIIATTDNEIARTTQLLRELDAAGHPGVENGEKIAGDYRQVYGSALPILERYRDAVKALPTDPQDFMQGLNKTEVNFAADIDDFVARRKATNQEAAESSQLRSAFIPCVPT
jgi:hypothetical protein